MEWLGLSLAIETWGGRPECPAWPQALLSGLITEPGRLSFCLGEIRLGCSHAKLGSGVSLLPTPGEEERVTRRGTLTQQVKFPWPQFPQFYEGGVEAR